MSRCAKEIFDGWEDTDRCLLDEHDSNIEHNFVDPRDDEKIKTQIPQ